MDIQEAAKRLDGNEYRSEGSRELFAEMKAAGLVAVFGASDDLAELRGAIDDEVGCWGGGTIRVTREGLFNARCDYECCPYDDEARKKAALIEAQWCEREDFSWTYETPIPHATFVINEDGEPYCKGIVFALADVGAS